MGLCDESLQTQTIGDRGGAHHQAVVQEIKVAVAPRHLHQTHRSISQAPGFVLLIKIKGGPRFTCQLFSGDTPLWTLMIYS